MPEYLDKGAHEIDWKRRGTTMNETTTPVAELCRNYGMSQSALARRFKIPLRTVQQWHAGHRKAPDYVVAMMDELLKRDNMDDLTGI